jgi:hypothetical protein
MAEHIVQKVRQVGVQPGEGLGAEAVRRRIEIRELAYCRWRQRHGRMASQDKTLLPDVA